jgi:hypothetical protein
MSERAQELTAETRRRPRGQGGFSDVANLDEDAIWPTAFALKELTAAEEARIDALVKKAMS